MAVLFVEWVGPDDMKSSVNIIQLDQMNPVLRGKDWYIAERFQKDRQAYRQLIFDVAMLLEPNLKKADLFKDIDELIAFETELVKIGVPDEERHDSGMRYKKMTLKDLTKLVPAFNFTAFLVEVFKGIPVHLTSSEPLVHYSYEYFSSLSPILKRTNRRTIQNYALWRVINSVLPNLPESFSKPRMDFLKSTTGISSDKKDWRKCVEATSKKLDYGVGALFIRDHFDHSSKAMAQEMIHNIREAFNELLEENDWMDKETKRVAREKANSMHEKIGYPDLFDDEVLLVKEYEGVF
ncbi:endothelin-converting enzyme 1-like [Tropilaelaps mercedesae]|uniref:Endothelin-converting enzyme 1-like n=1 Tax=Tropilaelaps mercedesae TaxID=418985 RepID=A0A1V9XXC4_9ACAR|nr:endothelin-converting enzyme 1-like [Tropilaelaps mercedesae]